MSQFFLFHPTNAAGCLGYAAFFQSHWFLMGFASSIVNCLDKAVLCDRGSISVGSSLGHQAGLVSVPQCCCGGGPLVGYL